MHCIIMKHIGQFELTFELTFELNHKGLNTGLGLLIIVNYQLLHLQPIEAPQNCSGMLTLVFSTPDLEPNSDPGPDPI